MLAAAAGQQRARSGAPKAQPLRAFWPGVTGHASPRATVGRCSGRPRIAGPDCRAGRAGARFPDTGLLVAGGLDQHGLAPGG
jgi:hypothetical protein